MQYTLYRVNEDGTRTEVSKHDTAYEGVVEGARITEYVDVDYSYELHNGGAEVTSFRPNRVAYREWAIRRGRLAGEYIHSLDDKYDTTMMLTNRCASNTQGSLSYEVVAPWCVRPPGSLGVV